MKTFTSRIAAVAAALLVSPLALAGPPISWMPVAVAVPADAPWAVAGIGAVLALVAVRMIKSRRR